MYIQVAEGNKCWNVFLVDAEESPYRSHVLLKSFPNKERALIWAYTLTKLSVAVGERRLSDVK
jgi:hypothetical protein